MNLTGKPAERLSYAGSVSLDALHAPAWEAGGLATGRPSLTCRVRKLSAPRWTDRSRAEHANRTKWDENTMTRSILGSAGVATMVVAVFQAVISFSPAWSSYFGAPPELVARPVLLLAAGLAATAVLVIFGVYAFSGAGVLRRLPAREAVLWAVGALFTARGLLVVPVLMIMGGLMHSDDQVPPTALQSALVSLGLGVLYLAGVWRLRKAERCRA